MAPTNELFDQTASNLEEAARGGLVVLVADKAGIDHLGRKAAHVIEVRTANSFVAPIIYAVPGQLLAYHAAAAKGTDVDQPRYLAKPSEFQRIRSATRCYSAACHHFPPP